MTTGLCHDGDVTTAPEELSAALLDAHVAWAVSELTGDRLAVQVERGVDDLLEIAAGHRLDELVDRENVKATAHVVVDIAGASNVVANLAVTATTRVHGMTAAHDHTLAEVVERDDIEALVGAFLRMPLLHDRGLSLLASSSLVGAVASKFVAKIVSDVVQQNRDRAERLPGVSSLFSIGVNAAGRVRRVADKPVEALFGDARDKSAQVAIRLINAAIQELIQGAPLQGAAMETWDLQGQEPMSDLHGYLRATDVPELAGIVYRLVALAGGSEYAGAAIDESIDAFFDSYGAHDLASFVDEFGITRGDLIDIVMGHARTALDALHSSGELESLIRSRVEPFFTSPAVTALLRAGPGTRAGATATRARQRAVPRPTKAAQPRPKSSK
jgi:hypothetical protein